MEINYLAIIFFLITLHYLFFLINIYKGLGRLDTVEIKTYAPEFLSVIIPFRNESSNLAASVQSLENQDYPNDKYEVIYVNDHSSDDSLALLTSFIRFKNFNICLAPDSKGLSGFKKRAVAFGIEKAKGKIIVTTDADCVHPSGWLSTISSEFDSETAMVSGPVEFNDSDRLLEKIQKLEFQGLIIAGAGLMAVGDPVICSAANLAYRKDVFNEVNGFSDNIHFLSGDDELLMQKIFRTGKYRIKFCANPDALVKTKANNTINEFFSQRKRWASKGLFYKDKILILRLILIFLFYLGIPVLAVLSFFSGTALLLLFFSLSVKLFVEYLIMKKGTRLIFRSNLMKYYLISEAFQILYIIIASVAGASGNINWKGRQTKR